MFHSPRLPHDNNANSPRNRGCSPHKGSHTPQEIIFPSHPNTNYVIVESEVQVTQNIPHSPHANLTHLRQELLDINSRSLEDLIFQPGPSGLQRQTVFVS